MSAPPLHLAPGPPRHGVTRLARELAAATGADLVTDWSAAARAERVHLHLCEGIAPGADGVAAVRSLATRTRLTLTLHDVPQPTDGAGFARRRALYRAARAAAAACAVSSHHEAAAVGAHLGGAGSAPPAVIPLPLFPDPSPGRGAGPDIPGPLPAGPTAAIFGFVYPGKGHAELIDAVARLRGTGTPGPTVVALGAAAPGHDRLLEELAVRAERRGVRFAVTGYLPEQQALAALRRVSVGVCGHRNVSASGSLNSWLTAGRRPVVRAGRYAREMERLRPGAHTLYEPDRSDEAGSLAAALARALASPATTRLAADQPLGPGPHEVARAYLRWWAEVAR